MIRTRRDVLKGLGVLAGATAAGCGRPGSSMSGASSPFFANPQFPGDLTTPTATPTATPLSPEELLSTIDHVVVLYMENRSFDQFFGSLKFVEGKPVEGLTGSEWNPDVDETPVKVWNLDTFTCADPPHDWDAQHFKWNHGANDGFVKSNATANPGVTAQQAMGYYVRSQLPTLYQFADAFSICDRWHCSLLGPTFPNRLYLHGATSNGLNANLPLLGYRSIFQVLDDAGISSKNYFHDLPFSADYLYFKNATAIEQFFVDAASGNLPAFSIIDPRFLGADENDDHPASDVRLGDALIGSIYQALAASPAWPRTLFVLSFDENGGFYDHVAPPTTVDDHPEFAQLGFRVPAIVAGGPVKRGAVVSTLFEHVSIISTLTKRFNLTPMNGRVSATNDLSSCIDPAAVGTPSMLERRPTRLAPVSISLGALRARMTRWQQRGDDEWQTILDTGEVPRQYNRTEDPNVVRRVLEAGARLGAVRLVA